MPLSVPGSKAVKKNRSLEGTGGRHFKKNLSFVVIGIVVALLATTRFLFFSPASFDLAMEYWDSGEKDRALPMLIELAEEGNLAAKKMLASVYLAVSQPGGQAKGERYLVEAAQAGDAESQLLLGKRFHSGIDTPPNSEEAVRWLTMASAQGVPEAMGILGEYYLTGEVVVKDTEKALNLIVGAAEKNDSGAMGRLGAIYFKGEVLARNYDEAERWLSRSDNAAFPDRNRLLGVIYYHGLGGERNISKAIPLLSTVESTDDPATAAALGLMYYYGEGIIPDDRKAEVFLIMAAEAGIPEAYGPLGTLYFDGIDGVPDYQAAFRYLRMADENGDTSACGKLGILYYEGKGVEEDASRAVEYLTRFALSHRDTAVNALLGRILYLGDGVLQNYPQAAIYLQLAAADGDIPSQAILANLYYQGNGVKRDYQAALRYLRQGVEIGHPPALGLLGRMHYYGDGVEWDKPKALALLKEAAAQGDTQAQDLLYEEEYTQQEIAARKQKREDPADTGKNAEKYIGDELRLFQNIRYGMTVAETERVVEPLAPLRESPRQKSIHSVWFNRFQAYAPPAKTPLGNCTFYFQDDMLCYVEKKGAVTTLADFMKRASAYANNRYLLAGVYSAQRGLIFDVFRDASNRFHSRSRTLYTQHYSDARKEALKSFEREAQDGIAPFEQVHLLFVRFDTADLGAVMPKDLKNAYARLGTTAVEEAPGLDSEFREVTYFSPAFRPLAAIERTYIWGDLYLGMDLNGALRNLRNHLSFGPNQVTHLSDYPDGFTKAYAIDAGKWHARLLFVGGALFNVEFFGKEMEDAEPPLPERLQNPGVYFPYALVDHDSKQILFSVFSPASPFPAVLRDNPDLSVSDGVRLADAFLRDCLLRCDRQPAVVSARLPEDFRFVDRETGKVYDDVYRFNHQLAFVESVVHRVAWLPRDVWIVSYCAGYLMPK